MNDEKPYIKKPPNAFMLFVTEQRRTIAAEDWKRGSGAVNAILGKMVTVFYDSIKPYYTFSKLRLVKKYIVMCLRYESWLIYTNDLLLYTVGFNVKKGKGRIFRGG